MPQAPDDYHPDQTVPSAATSCQQPLPAGATTRPIGVLVLHGIGNQSPGSVGRPIADCLADPKTEVHRETTFCTTLQHSSRPIIIWESNWSHISSPNNVPRIHISFQYFLSILKTAYLCLASFFGFAQRKIVPLLIALALICTLCLVVIAHSTPEYVDQFDFTWFTIVAMFVVSMSSIVFETFYKKQHARLNRWWGAPLKAALALIYTSCVFLLFLPAAIMVLPLMLVLSSAVFLTGLALSPLVLLLRTLTVLSRIPGLEFIRLWLHRFTWMLIIFPPQTFAQLAKGLANFGSIFVMGPGSLLARFLAYFTMAALQPLCCILIVAICAAVYGWALLSVFGPVLFVWHLHEELADVLSAVVWLIPLVLMVATLKYMLTILDLLLDVSSYHLASEEEREEYGRFVRDGVSELRVRGCTGILIVAHSLGSVIFYDWLRRWQPGGTSDVVGLITMGSPLNKFWYVDHGYERRQEDITGSVTSGIAWHNFYAWSDPLSGRLRRYGGVTEHRLRWLGLWGVAHVKYWKSREVEETLRKMLDSG